jgi:hypothetical protein
MDKKFGLLLEILALVLVITITLAIGPAAFLYTFGGAEVQRNLAKYMLYAVMGAVVVLPHLVVPALRYLNVFDKYPALEGFKHMTVHTPQDSWLGDRFAVFRNPLALAAIGTAIGMIVALGLSLSGTFGTGTPTFVQGSFEPSDNPVQFLGLAVEPAVTAETLLLNVIYYLSFGSVFYVLYRQGAEGWPTYAVAGFVSVIVATVSGFAFHVLRYGLETMNAVAALGLFFIKSLTIAVFNSAIVAYMIHFWNNLFHAGVKSGIFNSDLAIALVFIGVVTSAIVLYFASFRRYINLDFTGGGGVVG